MPSNLVRLKKYRGSAMNRSVWPNFIKNFKKRLVEKKEKKKKKKIKKKRKKKKKQKK